MSLFEEARKLSVWDRGTMIPGEDPRVWRRDVYGNLMLFSAYGNRGSDWGWEIDHIVPVARGGSDDLANLRPLHWRSNLLRG